jgi:glycosyltransferase involved in cell wall biosynthesis
MAHALAERDWQVTIWTSNAVDEATWEPAYSGLQHYDGAVRVRRFPVQTTRNPERFALFSRAFFRTPSWARPENKWLRMQGPYVPDMVNALRDSDPLPTLFTPYLFYPTLAGIRVSPHPRLLMPAAHDERPFALKLVAHAFDAADGLLFHTPEEQELANSRYPQAAGLPSGVGTVGVEKIVCNNLDAISAYQPYIYFGGRTTPGKGMETLLQGLQLAREAQPDIRLVVSGAASDDPAFKGSENVETVGIVDGNVRNQLLSGAIAAVVPGSLESLSMLALESWAAGRPCILNGDSAVLAGQARRTQGALTFNSAATLGDAIIRLHNDPALAANLGTAGQNHVLQTYRWDAVAERIEKVVDAI